MYVWNLCWLGCGQKCEQTTSTADGENVVDQWCCRSQYEETGKNDDGQKQGIVVEDGECGGLVIGDLILLPQCAFVLLFAADLLVIGQLLGDFAGHSVLTTNGHLVFQGEFGVSVGHGHQIGAQTGDQNKEH